MEKAWTIEMADVKLQSRMHESVLDSLWWTLWFFSLSLLFTNHNVRYNIGSAVRTCAILAIHRRQDGVVIFQTTNSAILPLCVTIQYICALQRLSAKNHSIPTCRENYTFYTCRMHACRTLRIYIGFNLFAYRSITHTYQSIWRTEQQKNQPQRLFVQCVVVCNINYLFIG